MTPEIRQSVRERSATGTVRHGTRWTRMPWFREVLGKFMRALVRPVKPAQSAGKTCCGPTCCN